MSRDTTRRILDFLGGQAAPVSPDGSGRRVLYRCNQCGKPWLQDGGKTHLELDMQEVYEIAKELSANLAHLPKATCRACSFTSGAGVVEIDQYGEGEGGFGFNWECEPLRAHLFATVVSLSWLARTPLLLPDVVSSPSNARAVLRWLEESTTFPCVHILSPDDSNIYAAGNPPGFAMPGTRHWLWRGGIFLMPCPPLNGQASVTLAVAMPLKETFDMSLLIDAWRLLAQQTLQGGIAGEEPIYNK